MKDSNLLFIISQPRSGSTLLQSILSNNSRVATTSEPWLLLPFLSLYKPALCHASYDYQLMSAAVHEYAHKNIGEEKFASQVTEFLLSLYAPLVKEEVQYVLDKTPRYYEISDLIVRFFPNAKIIILKRNPLDVLYSILNTWHIDSLDKLLSYRNDLLLAPQMMQDFLVKNKNNPNVYSIQYEEMVSQPAVIFKHVYEWLALPYTENVLSYGQNNKWQGQFGDQVGIKKRTTPEASSMGLWREIVKIPFWNNVFRGYSAYLGHEFLADYGNYTGFAPARTKEFNYYLTVYGLKEGRKLQPYLKFKQLMKYMLYRLQMGSHSAPHVYKQTS